MEDQMKITSILLLIALTFSAEVWASNFNQFFVGKTNSQAFTGSGTWTVPVGVSQVAVLAVGGGGGGVRIIRLRLIQAVAAAAAAGSSGFRFSQSLQETP
jgi:hypothetical protein